MNAQHLPKLSALLVLILCSVQLNSAYAADSDAAGVEFFEKKIRPVLVQHCYKCHSAESEKIKGKLRVDSRAALQKGGESGPGVVPGNPEKSLLVEAVLYKNPDLQMPPKEKLPDAVMQDIVEWVKVGAPWPAEKDAKAVTEEKTLDFERLRKEIWSLQPLKQEPPPAVQDNAWAGNPIDQFVLAKLEQNKLKPGPAADKRALLRRVSFDLTGLPPTPEQIEEFLSDESPGAFEKVVDRLLASRHFGERWGRHWLDVARYAETAGGGRIVPLGNAWRYRQYVIDAFNKDKPYDRFVREQLAGDLLPSQNNDERNEQVTATGFLAIGPKNLDTQDKDLLRMDVVDEQLDTIGKTMLGMTIGCSRCHDHKFDPIPMRDYYALAGIFRSTKTLTPGNVSGVVQARLPVEPALQKKVEEHDRRVAALESEMQKLKEMDVVLKPGTAPAVARTADAPAKTARKGVADPATLPGIVMDNTQANIVGTWIKSFHIKSFVGEGYIHDSNKSKGEMTVSFSPSFPKTGLYEVRMSYTHSPGRANHVPVIIQSADGEKIVEVNQELEPPIDGLFISLGKFHFNQGNDGSVTISNTKTTGYVIVDAVQFLPVEDPGAVASGKPAPAADPIPEPPAKLVAVKVDGADIKAQLKKLEAEIKDLKKNGPAAPTTLGVMEEEQVGDYNIALRGDVHRLGDKVSRGFLSLVSYEAPAVNPKQSGRLELAAWMTDARNPLLSRVMVNRIWHHLFGAGIVRTTDNFGVTGEQPSHPELLDYLAGRFMAGGWSVKKTIRDIVLSRTYQLSSAGDAAAAKADPENRLLSRTNRRRLDVEAIRDSILLDSGQLDLSVIEGDPVKDKSRAVRRTVYMNVERESLDGMLESFDFADPNLVVGARNTSNLPTQALFLMNSPFVIEQSRKAAARLLAVPDLDHGARIALAYTRALGREPTPAEREVSLKFVTEAIATGSGNQAHAWACFYQALYACVDFRFVN